MTINNMRIDSVWDLLVARIAALEERVLALENGDEHDGWLDPADLQDAETDDCFDGCDEESWIGGTD